MNRKTLTLFAVALAMISAGAFWLARLGSHQKLGSPGVRWAPSGSNIVVNILLPGEVLGCTSEEEEMPRIVYDVLPKDTSFAHRRYKAADGFFADINVVLMGTDRTSIHKPQFCLEGAGWRIDNASSTRDVIRIDRPQPYDLPVMKYVSNKTIDINGQPTQVRGIYVFWFVADGEYTASHWERMWWMARDVLTTGVLQRWAYVSCMAVCSPGQEAATFDRMKKLLAAAVPEFQLTPRPAAAAVAAGP